jgi:hypothetical protein
MLRLICFVVLLFQTSHILAQEVLTDFMRGGNLSHVFLHEYDEDKVVLEVSPFDEVLLYHVNDGALSLTWSASVPGVFDINGLYIDLRFVDSYLVLDIETAVLAYDLTTGISVSYDNPYEPRSISIRHQYDDIIDVEYVTPTFSDRTRVRIDLGGQSVDTLTARALYLSPNIEITEHRPDSLDYAVWQVHDLRNGTSWDIIHHADLYTTNFPNDDLFIYHVGDSIFYVDISDRSSTLLHAETDEFLDGVSTYDLDSLYAIVQRPSTTEYETHLIIFDKRNRDTTVYRSQHDFFLNRHMIKVDDYLVVDDGEVLDLDTDNLLTYTSFLGRIKPLVLGDSLLLVARTVPFVQVLGEPDLGFPAGWPDWRAGQRNPQVMDIGDDWLVCFPSATDGGAKLWTLPKNTSMARALVESDILPSGQTGLREEARLVKAGQSLALLEDDLYSVIDDKVTQINTAEPQAAAIGNSQLCISQDTIFWAEGFINGSRIYWYAHNQSGLYAELDFGTYLQTLIQFAVADGLVFFQASSQRDSIAIYDTGAERQEVLPTTGRRAGRDLLAVNGIVYTISDDSLCYVDQSGIHPVLEVSIRGQSLSSRLNTVLTLRGRQYFGSQDKIYDITDPSDPQLVVETVGFDHFGQISENFATVLARNSDEVFLFDGTTLSRAQIDIAGERSQFRQHLLGDLIVMTSWADDQVQSSIFDFASDDLIELPALLSSQTLVEAVIHNQDTLLITTVPDGIASDVIVYRMTDRWQEAEEIDAFRYGGGIPFFDYKSFGDDGLMYVGESVYLIDEELYFEELGGIFADILSRTIHAVGDHFYCIAIEPQNGRQLFRILTPSGRQTSSIVDDTDDDLLLAPNPTGGEIFLDVPAGEPLKYRVLSTDGRLVDQGYTDGVINISSQESGTYLIQVFEERRTSSVMIVKI